MIQTRNDRIADAAGRRAVAERLSRPSEGGPGLPRVGGGRDHRDRGAGDRPRTRGGAPPPGDTARAMRAIRAYVRAVDAINRVVGLFAMYLIFAMMGILFYSSITKTIAIPPLWALEMAQFTMTAYYILGGAYSLQLDAHVRMDLLYGRWSPRTKAAVDSATVLLLAFYLVFLLDGGYASTAYALHYDERSYSAWAPYMAPIKIVMCVGILLMLLQTIATFFRNVAEARGRPLDEGAPVPAAVEDAQDVPGRETSQKVAGERRA